MNLINKEKEYIFQTYKRLPIVIEKAVGARIYAEDGTEYLDFLGGIAVNALGHTHPRVLEAIETQAKKYLHVSNYFYQDAQIKLAEKLVEMTSFDRVFFSNSGTEAIEGALKLARRWGNKNNKKEIIAFTGGFHGRTYGALSIMDKPQYKAGMEPFLSDCKVITHNDIEQLKANVNENTAALVLEFIQGEGGLAAPSEEFISALKELKNQYEFLLIADEIQAGAGRTGKFFGHEHFDVDVDVVTMAKGIGGGLPLGGIMAKEALADVWEKGMHGTTYGGNALACATGYVVLEELESGLLNHVNKIGSYLTEKLNMIKEKYSDKVIELRGMGCMQGLLLNFDAALLVAKLLERKVITNAASGTVLRLVPPYIINENDVDEFITALDESLSEL